MASHIIGLVNKVQEKAKEVTDGVGDGLQKVANKTEDLTKRVNRTVNPFSSHFGERSNHSSPAAQSSGSRSNRSHSEDINTQIDSGVARENSNLTTRSSMEEASSKAVTEFAQKVLDQVNQEIQALEEEKAAHLTVLRQLEELQKEQETAYREAEEKMELKEKEMRSAIKRLETDRDVIEVQF